VPCGQGLEHAKIHESQSGRLAQVVRPACRQAGRSLDMILLMNGFYVYIVRSVSTGKYYTGMTSNIDRRVKEHNQHLSNVMTTRNNNDYSIIFCSWFDNRDIARSVEKYLKSGAGREFRANRLK